MSLFSKIATMLSGGSARKVCVVDGDRMVGGDRIGPGERFQALNKLSRFAGREKMDIRVVFGGRPLREAEDKSVYNGVKVCYGETEEAVGKMLIKELGAVGQAGALLVTSDQKLEEESKRKGFSTMRVSTMRKAMDAGSSDGEGSGRDSGRRGGRRSGRSRGGRNGDSRPNRGGRGQRSSEGQSEKTAEAPAAGGNDGVKNLIDLVE